ncbi:ATP-binding protein [Thermodesulfobacteriota bacterium]
MSTQYPVVTVTGPRQSGKTTLCRTFFSEKPYFNLEVPDVRLYAQNDPRGFLKQCPDGAVLDEIQRVPDLLSYIQGIVDERSEEGLFILTGSQQFEVLNTVSQSLAGRTALIKLLPFSFAELSGYGIDYSINRSMVTGFYPRIYDKKLNPTQALGDYFETYIERDLRQLTTIKDISLFEKFVRLCAGRVGQLLNLQSLAADTGISHTTARTWMTLLEASYIVFLLQPWHNNFSRRQVKSAKLYFYDVGLVSYLLGIENEKQAARDPLRGGLFENMAIIEALKYRFNRALRPNIFFFRDAKGHEIDLIIERGRDVFPVEIKAGETIAGDYFKGLRHFARTGVSMSMGGGLIYAGSDVQKRTGWSVYPLPRIEEMLDSNK